MARYAISEQGVTAMKMLSKNLLLAANNIIESGTFLSAQVAREEIGLGIYCDEIQRIVNEHKNVLNNHREEIVGLAQTASKKAEEIAKLLVFAGAGVAVGATGVGRIENANGLNKANSSSLAPTRKKPRDLSVSQYGFNEDSSGNQVYDSPIEMDDYLYKTQGKANPKFQGTCGLCSCANIMRLAGVNLGEGDMINYASKTNSPNSIFEKLCDVGNSNPYINGGTGPEDRKNILEHFGIDSGLFPIDKDSNGRNADSNIDKIAQFVSSGKGVILSVHAYMLWNDLEYSTNDLHAVVVTSVKKTKSGTIDGFYICDSADGGTKYYPAKKLCNALSGARMNVTHGIIR